jgi:hypothetical protein
MTEGAGFIRTTRAELAELNVQLRAETLREKGQATP